MADAAAATSSRRRGRALHAATGLQVSFEVKTTAPPTTLTGAVTALSGDATSFVAALQSAGLPVTGVSVAPPELSVRAPEVPQNFMSAAAQSTYLAALVSNVNAIGSSSATSPQVVQLIASAADALNSPTSQLNASAAADIRTSLLSAVAGAAANASTPLALQSVADAVARVEALVEERRRLV